MTQIPLPVSECMFSSWKCFSWGCMSTKTRQSCGHNVQKIWAVMKKVYPNEKITPQSVLDFSKKVNLALTNRIMTKAHNNREERPKQVFALTRHLLWIPSKKEGQTSFSEQDIQLLAEEVTAVLDWWENSPLRIKADRTDFSDFKWQWHPPYTIRKKKRV